MTSHNIKLVTQTNNQNNHSDRYFTRLAKRYSVLFERHCSRRIYQALRLVISTDYNKNWCLSAVYLVRRKTLQVYSPCIWHGQWASLDITWTFSHLGNSCFKKQFNILVQLHKPLYSIIMKKTYNNSCAFISFFTTNFSLTSLSQTISKLVVSIMTSSKIVLTE